MKKKPRPISLTIVGTENDIESFQKLILVAEFLQLKVVETTELLNLRKTEGKRIIETVERLNTSKSTHLKNSILIKSGLKTL